MYESATHRTLRIILSLVSILEAVAGVVLVFASNLVLALLPATLPSLSLGLVLVLLKGIGIVGLALAYLFWTAARDPERYLAVIDALAFILVAAAVLEIYALRSLGFGLFYPPLYLIIRAALQLALAAAILALRPKPASAAT